MEEIQTDHISDQKIQEPEIVSRILNGEKGLYEILVRRHNQKLYRVIRTYLKSEAEIEDVMQNSYLKAYSKLAQFKLESSFSTWLIRIAINESLARIKEKGKIWYINDYPKNGKEHNSLEILDDKELNAQDKMIRNETKQLLESAIDQLDIKYRSVYVMKEVEGMSLKEVAVALDLTLSNVKVRVHRAKQMVKENLFISTDLNVFEFGFSRCDRITENVMQNL